jgi:hypothetical protein
LSDVKFPKVLLRLKVPVRFQRKGLVFPIPRHNRQFQAFPLHVSQKELIC